MELREYQKKQLEFLNKYKGITRGFQSPTGTGKSIVLLSYVKECLEDYDTIVFTTGFNELVFQLKDDADKMGINAQILIGLNHLIIDNDNDDILYSKIPVNQCNDTNCKNCNICYKDKIKSFMDSKKKVIITNHSYFIIYKDKINADLVIIDEAHSFSEFYKSYMTKTMDGNDYIAVKNYLNGEITPIRNAFTSMIGKNMDEKFIQVVANDILKTSGNLIENENDFIKKFTDVFRTYHSGILEDTGSSFKTSIFFNKIELNIGKKYPDVILSSATIDTYTAKIFGCCKDLIYKQKLPEFRYKNSMFISCHDNYRNKFESVFFNNNFNYKRGLILCTTMENVNWTIKILNEKNINIFRNIDDFDNVKNGILIGSKKFFQGVNISNLDFVILDKLPFDIYDEQFKGYSKFMNVTTKTDPWKEYTLSLMKNQLLQALGRLWRINDIDNDIYDDGIICLFDRRLGGNMKFIEDFILREKSNIQFKIVE